jgi:hypothetical protein
VDGNEAVKEYQHATNISSKQQPAEKKTHVTGGVEGYK